MVKAHTPLYTIEKVGIQEILLAAIQLSTCMVWTGQQDESLFLPRYRYCQWVMYLIPCVSFGLYLVELSLGQV